MVVVVLMIDFVFIVVVVVVVVVFIVDEVVVVEVVVKHLNDPILLTHISESSQVFDLSHSFTSTLTRFVPLFNWIEFMSSEMIPKCAI